MSNETGADSSAKPEPKPLLSRFSILVLSSLLSLMVALEAVRSEFEDYFILAATVGFIAYLALRAVELRGRQLALAAKQFAASQLEQRVDRKNPRSQSSDSEAKNAALPSA